ncbi:uncharacterized protein LOC5506128 isoform X2 [Nematostella vectensis]|nr:uncharacterized protein LOC5506128 isoform X2 [Nematostella vectensis]
MKSSIAFSALLQCLLVLVIQGNYDNGLEQLGCYRNRHCALGGRPFPVHLKTFHDALHMNESELEVKVIRPCAELAKKKGYLWFGIEYWGECWSGEHAHSTYFKDGRSSHCCNGVGKDNTVFAYRIKEPMCDQYMTFDDETRAQNYTNIDGPFKTDNNGSTNHMFAGNLWYRFLGNTGTAIATTCVPPRHCDAILTGWMKDEHPRVTDGVVNRTVFFSDSENGKNDCYNKKVRIQVRNCGGYYVYKLPEVPLNPARYCGNGRVG